MGVEFAEDTNFLTSFLPSPSAEGEREMKREGGGRIRNRLMLGEPREYREASRKLMSMLVWREELREALCLD